MFQKTIFARFITNNNSACASERCTGQCVGRRADMAYSKLPSAVVPFRYLLFLALLLLLFCQFVFLWIVYLRALPKTKSFSIIFKFNFFHAIEPGVGQQTACHVMADMVLECEKVFFHFYFYFGNSFFISLCSNEFGHFLKKLKCGCCSSNAVILYELAHAMHAWEGVSSQRASESMAACIVSCFNCQYIADAHTQAHTLLLEREYQTNCLHIWPHIPINIRRKQQQQKS